MPLAFNLLADAWKYNKQNTNKIIKPCSRLSTVHG